MNEGDERGRNEKREMAGGCFLGSGDLDKL